MLICLICFALQGCGPTKQQLSEAVQCKGELKRIYILSQETLQEYSDIGQVSNKFATVQTGKCPVSGAPYSYNPHAGKWLHFESNRSEIAVYCSKSHLRIAGQYRFAAIKFDGAFDDLTNALPWPKP